MGVAAEMKAVLDSWARYEQQLKESEQADLAKSVIDKVLKTLQDEKVQRELLTNAIAEVERKLCKWRARVIINSLYSTS